MINYSATFFISTTAGHHRQQRPLPKFVSTQIRHHTPVEEIDGVLFVRAVMLVLLVVAMKRTKESSTFLRTNNSFLCIYHSVKSINPERSLNSISISGDVSYSFVQFEK